MSAVGTANENKETSLSSGLARMQGKESELTYREEPIRNDFSGMLPAECRNEHVLPPLQNPLQEAQRKRFVFHDQNPGLSNSAIMSRFGFHILIVRRRMRAS